MCPVPFGEQIGAAKSELRMQKGNPDSALMSPRTFLTAEWRYLVMLNYEVDPELLAGLMPSGTELDFWNGRTFVSLVGFRFLKTRVLGMAFPFHCNFEEVNLRFYVRRRVREEVRRGVVFVREIVPRRAIALVARFFYGERYVALPMSHEISSTTANIDVNYCWKIAHSWNTIRVAAAGEPFLPSEGSVEQFIAEHYCGYAASQDGGCVEYEVGHPQWRIWRAVDGNFSGSMAELYGGDLDAILQRAPDSALLAEGSPVSVHRGNRLSTGPIKTRQPI
jgi:uncharacterized protein YqjF (DUF2071 family)